jgi:XXXCH domain-containing protein
MVADKESCSSGNLQGVADELRKLADQIEAGQVKVSGVTLSIGNAVSLTVKQKLAGGQVKFDVGLTASLLAKEPVSPFTPQPHNIPRDATGKSSKMNKKTRPYEIKKIKKTISQHWKDISSAIIASRIPDAALQSAFLKTCEEYGRTAEDEWHPLWQELVASMKRLLKLANEGNFPEAAAVLDTINNHKKSCHKRFK